MSNYMGIDIGTSGCKAAVFNDEGKQLCIAYREYDLISPKPNWAELDSQEVMGKCFDVVKECTSGLPAESVAGLGISSQGEAFTPVDTDGRCLCNALVSSDARAGDYVKSWSQKFGRKKLYQITGHTPHPMFSLFKLLWLKDNRIDIWDKTYKFLYFEDMLQFRFGIKNPAMGWPLAGRTMLFDVRKHQWSAEILSEIGLDANRLARPLKSGSISGYISSDVADRIGLSKNTFVVTGGHDQTCCALGAGATNPGVAAYSSGTVECITPAFAEPVFSDSLFESNLCTYDHTADGLYASVAFSLTGGNVLKWFRDQFGYKEIQHAKDTGKDPYELLLSRIDDKPSDLLVLPYFTPSGTPYFDAETKGAILGLRLSTKKEDILRALLEGVALEMRLNLDILEKSGCRIDELRIIGGGAKSDILNQLKADVLGKKITVMDVTEAGCMGAAMLAKAAEDNRGIRDIAKGWCRPVNQIKPNKEFSDIYQRKFKQYKNLYLNIKSLKIG